MSDVSEFSRSMQKLGAAYGVALGRFAAGCEAFGNSLRAAAEAEQRAAAKMKLEARDPFVVRERTSQRVYANRLRIERSCGLAYVQSEAARVRRELGMTS